MRKNKQITARVTDEVADILSELALLTSESQSEIIMKSILAYYENACRGKRRKILLQKGFIGCASLDTSFSKNYKNELHRGLSKKGVL